MYHCVLVVILGMLKALSEASGSWLDVPRVYVICSCCHARHEWTHLWVGCICFECALYVVVVTLGMSGPICEWAVSVSCVHYMFLLSLLARVDPSVSGLYLFWVWVICSCCHSWHEWTHLWVGCICLVRALHALVVTLGMSRPICEWAVSALHLLYMLLLSLFAWVDPSVSGVYLLRLCIICFCCNSWHEWSHLRVCCVYRWSLYHDNYSRYWDPISAVQLTTQSHAILTHTGPFNLLIALAYLTTLTPLTHTQTNHTHSTL